MKKLPELLAPAGDMTSLQAVLDNGADAAFVVGRGEAFFGRERPFGGGSVDFGIFAQK